MTISPKSCSERELTCNRPGAEYTTIKMTLYKILNGNMQTEEITAAEFGE